MGGIAQALRIENNFKFIGMNSDQRRMGGGVEAVWGVWVGPICKKNVAEARSIFLLILMSNAHRA